MAYMGDPVTQLYCIGSVVGPHPFPMMVRDFQRVVGIEAREQFHDMTGDIPDIVTACVGGGSNAMGLFSGFLADPCEIHGVEPLGRGTATGDHAATMTYGREGVLHGFNSYVLQDEAGQPSPVYSIASGLDYPSVGPEHAFLKDSGRVKYFTATDRESVEAFYMLSRLEGIIPALESAHSLAHAIRLSRSEPKHPRSILVNLSGRGDKDMDYVLEHYGTGEGFEA
jgi:tryptophan synthase beta subunit